MAHQGLISSPVPWAARRGGMSARLDRARALDPPSAPPHEYELRSRAPHELAAATGCAPSRYIAREEQSPENKSAQIPYPQAITTQISEAFRATLLLKTQKFNFFSYWLS